MNARASAARVVHAVLDHGRSLDAALAEFPEHDALTQELAYGTIRHALRLDAMAARLLDRPVKNADRDIHALILVGLYQLFFQRIAAHAAVDETVNAVRALGKPWARGLVNAVLRTSLRASSLMQTPFAASCDSHRDVPTADQSRQVTDPPGASRSCALTRDMQKSRDGLLHQHKDTVSAALETEASIRFCLPVWLLDQIRADWPGHWEAIAEASLQRPPMSLRVNARAMTRDAYLGKLLEAGIAATPIPETEQGITLTTPCAVSRLPGFAEGWVSVQDGGAQLAAALLDVGPNAYVLDAAAAPGGKACHLLERHSDCELVALDLDAGRLNRVRENFSRLHLGADIRQGDAATPEAWWDGRVFDRILLDAPCSGTGVIRRHPDIKIHRRRSDIAVLAHQQGLMLDGLWPLLAHGGKLLYVTCSILSEENAAVMTAFLSRTPDARAAPVKLAAAHACPVGAQVLPGESGMDGFYFALIEKT